jgi:hypothetical protein
MTDRAPVSPAHNEFLLPVHPVRIFGEDGDLRDATIMRTRDYWHRIVDSTMDSSVSAWCSVLWFLVAREETRAITARGGL